MRRVDAAAPTPSRTPTTSRTAVTPLPSEYDRWSASTAVVFGYDAGHSYYNPFEKTLSVSNVAKLRPRSFLVKGGIIPTVADQTLYLGSSDGDVYAIDMFSGQQKWATTYVLDSVTGKLRWSFLVGGMILSPPAVVMRHPEFDTVGKLLV